MTANLTDKFSDDMVLNNARACYLWIIGPNFREN